MASPGEFFRALWGEASGIAELRCFGGEFPKGHQEFFAYPDALAAFCDRAANLSGRTGVYFGVSLKSRYGGKKEDTKAVTALWVDVDENYEAGLKALRAFPLKASIGVLSGRPTGGIHAYWLLKEPVEGADLERIRPLNLALARKLGADQGACDIARVMRFPGTINTKYPGRPTCKIAVWRPDVRYNPEDFDFLPVEEPTPAPQPLTPGEVPATDLPEGLAAKVAELLGEIWIKGWRHQLALCMAGMFAQHGVSEASAVALIHHVATSRGDTEDRTRAVRDTYAKFVGGQPVAGAPTAEKMVEDFPDVLRPKAVKILALLHNSLKKERERSQKGGLNFEIVQITKRPSDPPSYWIVIRTKDGKEAQFDVRDPQQLVSFRSFQSDAFGKGDVVVRGKQSAWERMLESAVARLKIGEKVEEATDLGALRSCLEPFLARSREDVNPGLLDSFPGHLDGKQFFALRALKAEMKAQGIAIDHRKLCELLRAEAWKPTTRYFGPTKTDVARVWIRSIEEKSEHCRLSTPPQQDFFHPDNENHSQETKDA